MSRSALVQEYRLLKLVGILRKGIGKFLEKGIIFSVMSIP